MTEERHKEHELLRNIMPGFNAQFVKDEGEDLGWAPDELLHEPIFRSQNVQTMPEVDIDYRARPTITQRAGGKESILERNGNALPQQSRRKILTKDCNRLHKILLQRLHNQRQQKSQGFKTIDTPDKPDLNCKKIQINHSLKSHNMEILETYHQRKAFEYVPFQHYQSSSLKEFEDNLLRQNCESSDLVPSKETTHNIIII